MTKTVEVFYSYHAQDEKLRQQLEKHLSSLKRKKRISTWSSQMIQPGVDRPQVINAHLNVADIILLLISSDFLASDYYYETEVQRAIERSQASETVVIPIILRPVDWTGTPFSGLTPLPTGGKPVVEWNNLDNAFYNISLGIQKAVEAILAKYDVENNQYHPDQTLQKPQVALAQDGDYSEHARGTLLCTYDIHSSYVVAAAWEPRGNHIASAGGDGLVRIWDADTGHTRLTYRNHPWALKKINMAPTIYIVAWSPEGLRLASAGAGKAVRVWNANTGQDIVVYSGHTGILSNVWALAWSPDGKRIASACSAISTDMTIHIWNATTGAKLLCYDSKQSFLSNSSVSSIAWAPDGKRIASAFHETIHLWSATTGKQISTFKATSNWIYKLAWSPDGKYLAVANVDTATQILDTSDWRVVTSYNGHTGKVRDVAWSPDGCYLATASNDTTVQIWDAKTGTCFYSYDGHASSTTSVAWSPDGTRIVSASDDKTVQVWQAV